MYLYSVLGIVKENIKETDELSYHVKKFERTA